MTKYLNYLIQSNVLFKTDSLTVLKPDSESSFPGFWNFHFLTVSKAILAATF